MHKYIEFRKRVGTNEHIYREGIETDVENGLVDTVEEGKESVGWMDKVALIYIYTIMCKKDSW